MPTNPVAPAERSSGALVKAATKQTTVGFGHTFTQLTRPTPLQARAFELLGLRP